MIVSIQQFTNGTCVWCCSKNVEVVHVQFKDGLAGFFCKRDFWAALKARAEMKNAKQQSPTSEAR